MAASVNKVTLIGNVGQAPSFKEHGNGFVSASFSLATTKTWKDRETQERRERTDWHRIEVTGRLAEIVRDIIGQGNQVYVEGELNTDRVESKVEPGKFDYFTKVRAESVQKLGKRERDEETGSSDAGGDTGTDTGADTGGDTDTQGGGDEAPVVAATAAPAAAPSAPSATGAPAAARAGPVVRSWKDRKKS